jgi:hypothetical protein
LPDRLDIHDVQEVQSAATTIGCGPGFAAIRCSVPCRSQPPPTPNFSSRNAAILIFSANSVDYYLPLRLRFLVAASLSGLLLPHLRRSINTNSLKNGLIHTSSFPP